MRLRLVTLAALAVTCAFAATAFATDTPLPAAPQPAPPISSLPGVLDKCTDSTPPVSTVKVKSPRKARAIRVVRGTARDTGCGVAMVTVSFSRVQGKHCKFLGSKRLGRSRSCRTDHWLLASGTSAWRLRLPRHLSRGTYRIRTRAIDFAANVERPHTKRLALR
jgi:hypothetical protein